MFDFLGYKKRLKNVRADLVELETTASGLATVVELDDGETSQSDLSKLAASVSGLCRILIRVLDSLPG